MTAKHKAPNQPALLSVLFLPQLLYPPWSCGCPLPSCSLEESREYLGEKLGGCCFFSPKNGLVIPHMKKLEKSTE